MLRDITQSRQYIPSITTIRLVLTKDHELWLSRRRRPQTSTLITYGNVVWPYSSLNLTANAIQLAKSSTKPFISLVKITTNYCYVMHKTWIVLAKHFDQQSNSQIAIILISRVNLWLYMISTRNGTTMCIIDDFEISNNITNIMWLCLEGKWKN